MHPATRCRTLLVGLAALLLLSSCGGGGDTERSPVATIALAAPEGFVARGASRRLDAVARDADGHPVADVRLVWESSDASVVTVEAGVLRALGTGTAVVRVHAGDTVSTPASFTVVDEVATSDALIASALAEGSIDAETALAYRVFALFGDARLPAALRSDEPEPSGNAVIEELAARWERLSAATRAQLAPFRTRPLTAGSWLAPDPTPDDARAQALAVARPTCAASATWGNVATSVANARIWYDKSRAADLTQAQEVAAALDTTIWPKLITTLGFNAPLSDAALACNGGDSRFDIFIVAGLAARGTSYPESTSAYQSSTFMLLRSGLTGSTLQYTLAHHFMHAVQWSYLMVATQASYGWMRNALANWAVEATYPGNAMLLADASCHMNSSFLTITSRATGSCTGSTTRTRDYGAYLLYQYIGRTAGNTKVRELLAATTTTTTALGAIDAKVVGGLRTLWPKYAKTLWNQPPVSNTGRPAFRNWDGQTAVPVFAPDHPTPVNADVGTGAEASTGLSGSVENVSTRFYRFTFTDTTTRSLMFRNTFYPLTKAGKKVSVQALWRTPSGWVEEDWSLKEWIGFCRDVKLQRLAELVVVVASGETGTVTQAVAATAPTFKRNKIGCWGWRGNARRTDISGSWSSGTVTVRSTLLFDYKPNGTASLQYNDAATGRLRVPIAAPLFSQAVWTLAEAYTENGCSYLLNAGATDTTIVLGGLAFGSIVINNFAESLPSTMRIDQQGVVGSARGAYHINAATNRFGMLGSVSGPQPDCGTQYASAPGMFTLTNATPATAPVIQLDGHLKGSFVSSSSPDSVVFAWDLAPLREP